MGVRGELFSTKVSLQNRTYFFNVKENRLGDLYLNIVESKNKDEGGFERQSVILFAEDLQEFLQGFDEALRILEKSVREKRRGPPPGKASAEKKEPRRAAKGFAAKDFRDEKEGGFGRKFDSPPRQRRDSLKSDRSPSRPLASSRTTSRRSERPDRPERPARSERPYRSDRFDRSERPSRPARSERSSSERNRPDRGKRDDFKPRRDSTPTKKKVVVKKRSK